MAEAASETWQEYLGRSFPGYLLPKTAHHQVSEESARAFLDSLGVRASDLELLKLMSLLAGHVKELEKFASYWLPELVRVLPCRSLVKRREWHGGYQGRLHVAATLAHRLAGDPDRYVTTARRRDFDLPENIFVKAVATRTTALLERLHSSELIHDEGWSASALLALSNLQVALKTSALREVSNERTSIGHIQAAKSARHPAFDATMQWYRAMCDALDSTDPEKLARILAQGALQPMDEPKRFEIAVLLSLLEGLATRLQPEDGWSLETRIIATGRKEVALFRRGQAEVGVYYDQAVLPLNGALGARDAGVAHYLNSTGRLRPDITVRTRREDGSENFTVFEIKLTEDLGYVASGFGEAIIYRHEYAEHLRGWPKAVVVSSCSIAGTANREHDVVAVSWAELPGAEILDGVLHSLAFNEP